MPVVNSFWQYSNAAKYSALCPHGPQGVVMVIDWLIEFIHSSIHSINQPTQLKEIVTKVNRGDELGGVGGKMEPYKILPAPLPPIGERSE